MVQVKVFKIAAKNGDIGYWATNWFRDERKK